MATAEPRAVQEARKRINDTKWEELEKRGITKPRSEQERQERLKAAHGGI